VFLEVQQHVSLIINVNFALFTNSDSYPWAVSINEVLLDLSHSRKCIHGKINRKRTWGLLGVINVFRAATIAGYKMYSPVTFTTGWVWYWLGCWGRGRERINTS
jgi:hypothetical protein